MWAEWKRPSLQYLIFKKNDQEVNCFFAGFLLQPRGQLDSWCCSLRSVQLHSPSSTATIYKTSYWSRSCCNLHVTISFAINSDAFDLKSNIIHPLHSGLSRHSSLFCTSWLLIVCWPNLVCPGQQGNIKCNSAVCGDFTGKHPVKVNSRWPTAFKGKRNKE